MGDLGSMARPERFELPTARFVAGYSIQLSYGRSMLTTQGYTPCEGSELSFWDV